MRTRTFAAAAAAVLALSIFSSAQAASLRKAGAAAEKTTVSAYEVRAATAGTAWVRPMGDGDASLRKVRVGDLLPGLGRVHAIEQTGGVWSVRTDKGLLRDGKVVPRGKAEDPTRVVVLDLTIMHKDGAISVSTLSMREGEVAPLQVISQRGYLAGVSETTTKDGAVKEELTPGVVATGLTSEFTARRAGDGHYVVDMNIDLSDLTAMRRVSSGRHMIEVPDVERLHLFRQETVEDGGTVTLIVGRQGQERQNRSNFAFGEPQTAPAPLSILRANGQVQAESLDNALAITFKVRSIAPDAASVAMK